MTLPLSGLLVVSLEQAVAAPMCTCRLADAGARVLKIERPEGDFARTYDTLVHGECSYFVWLNRGKELVVLDLTTAADRALFAAMLKRADIFVQNLKPGAIDKLGFPIAELRREFPRLICCSISGFGETGPYAARKAYDLLIQAESGLASITGTSEPARVGVSVVDITTGMNAYQSILEALIGRARTGEGAELSVSMFDAMADWMAVPLLQLEGGKPPQRMGLAHTSIAPYGAFKSRDGVDILICVQNDREWRVLAKEVLDDPALAADPAFATNVERTETPRRDRRKSRRQIRHARCRRSSRKSSPPPTSPLRRSTRPPSSRIIRICAASPSARQAARSRIRRRRNCTRQRRGATVRYLRSASTLRKCGRNSCPNSSSGGACPQA